MITAETSWESALKELTALPDHLQELHGDTNFMRSGRFVRNGHALFELAKGVAANRGPLEVVQGFVDASIVRECGLSVASEHVTTFESLTLRVAGTDEVFVIGKV